MIGVVVHSKPNCPQCVATIRKLTKENIPHEITQLTDDSITRFKAAGQMTAPVVVTPNGTFSGFRPDLIEALKEEA